MPDREKMNMRDVQAAESRQKLLTSAQQLFAEKGYKGTSVREINRRVNLADGLLYHYFPGGKKEIFQAVICENMRQILADLEEKIHVDSYLTMPLQETLEMAYKNFAQVIDQHIDIIRILFRENDVREFVTPAQLQELTNGRKFWLQELLERKCAVGEVCEMDFETAAMSVHAILMNHLMAKAFDLDTDKMDDPLFRERMIAYLVDRWKKR